MAYRIVITPAALAMLKEVTDARERRKLVEAIDGLKDEPEKKGKPLLGEFAGYRSLRAVGQRYRVVYAVAEAVVTVTVVALGRRKAGSRRNIYELARKLIKQRLVDAPKRK